MAKVEGLNPRHLAIPFQRPREAGARLSIAVRIWTGATRTNRNPFTVDGTGGMSHAPEPGPAELIATREQLHGYVSRTRALFSVGIRILLVAIGLACFPLFFVAGRRPENLWLGLALVTNGLPYVFSLLLTASELPICSVPAVVVSLCARLRRPLLAVAAIQFFIALAIAYCYANDIDIPEGLSVSMYLGIGASLLVAVWLVSERRGKKTSLLAFALGVVVIAEVWSARIVPMLGLPARYRYPELGPFLVNVRDLALLVFAVLAGAGLYLRLRDESQRQQRVDRDLSAARLIQEALIGFGIADTPGFLVDAAYLPASEVSGDFYQSLPGADGSLLLITGDVSGKGLPASPLVEATLGALGSIPSRPARAPVDTRRLYHVSRRAISSRWAGGSGERGTPAAVSTRGAGGVPRRVATRPGAGC